MSFSSTTPPVPPAQPPGRPASPALRWATYVDPAAWPVERATCFRGAWHHVGHVDELPDVGARRATRALDVPVLLVRTAAAGDAGAPGAVRAYRNTCPHRGSLLVDPDAAEPCAASRTIMCPYHAWTFDLDGSLRAAPRRSGEVAAGAADVDGSLDLAPLRCERWGPFVFVALDDDAPPLESWLGPVPGRVEAAGVDVNSLRFAERCRSTYAADWKVLCENYLECYHCRVAHPGFCSLVDVSEDVYELEALGRWASQHGPVHPDAAARAPWTQGSVTTGSFHFVFPNLFVNVAPGAPNVSLGPVLPTGTGTAERVLDYCVHEGWSTEQLAALRAWDDEVGDEDRALVERVQRGLAGAVAAGDGERSSELLPESERLVAWFAGQVRASIGGAG